MVKKRKISLLANEPVHEYKVRCLEHYLDEVRKNFPNMEDKILKVIYSNSKVTEKDFKEIGDHIQISDTEVSYWFTPYSEPGSPKMAVYKINAIEDLLNKVVKEIVFGTNPVDYLSDEKDLTGEYKIISDKLVALRKEKNAVLQSNIKKLLGSNEALYQFFKSVLNLDVDSIKYHQEKGVAKSIGMTNEDIDWLIQSIMHSKYKNKARSFISFFLFKLDHAARQSKPNKHNLSTLDWQSNEFHSSAGKLNKYKQKIEAKARRFYESELEKFSKSELSKEINSLVFGNTF